MKTEVVTRDFPDCTICGADITFERGYYRVTTSSHRGVRKVNKASVCRTCHQIELAETEADDEGRRYTRILVAEEGTPLSYYVGARCKCGRPQILLANWDSHCPGCWRDKRMLKQAEADVKFIRKLLEQMKGELNGKQHSNNRATA